MPTRLCPPGIARPRSARRWPISAKVWPTCSAALASGRGTDGRSARRYQIQGFFDIPVDKLYGLNRYWLIDLVQPAACNLMIVSPISAGVVRGTRRGPRRIGVDLAIIDNVGRKATQSEKSMQHQSVTVRRPQLHLIERHGGYCPALCATRPKAFERPRG